MTASLTGNVALVTGAARGLGAAIVERLTAEGATVVAADRRADEGQEVAQKTGATFIEMDVTDEQQWTGAVAAVVRDHGRLDTLVNNAGIIRVNSILETDPEEFRKVIDTNLVGAFLGVRAVARPMMAHGGGSIININSPAGTEGTPNMAAYASSKWAIRGLTRTAALEFGADGIRVNTVIPGPMRTAMTRRPGWTDEDYEAFYGATVPLGRMGNVREVAEMVAWLASDASSYCTGADFHADGGVTAGSLRR